MTGGDRPHSLPVTKPRLRDSYRELSERMYERGQNPFVHAFDQATSSRPPRTRSPQAWSAPRPQPTGNRSPCGGHQVLCAAHDHVRNQIHNTRGSRLTVLECAGLPPPTRQRRAPSRQARATTQCARSVSYRSGVVPIRAIMSVGDTVWLRLFASRDNSVPRCLATTW